MTLPISVDLWGVLSNLDSQVSMTHALQLMVDNPNELLTTGQRGNQLTQLDLRGLQLERLPKGLPRLKQLEALYLSDNGLKILPDDIGNIEKLRTLSLGKNQFNSLPDSCSELWDSLVHLYLGHNTISVLPFDVSLMAYLKVGSIGTNPIEEPIDTICWMLRSYAEEMPERLGFLVANDWSIGHQSGHSSLFLNQAICLAQQMDEPMVYEAFYAGTFIDDQGIVHWGDFFCSKTQHIQEQRRQLGLSLLPHITRGACVHPSLWAQNISMLDLSLEDWIWDWSVTSLPIKQLKIHPDITAPDGWHCCDLDGVYSPKSSSIS